MKEKLKKFKAFAATVLPHEATYLVSINKFADDDKKSILRKLAKEASLVSGSEDYDVRIDKRKYSSLQTWIGNELAKIDVDKGYLWISTMMQDILLDRVTTDGEASILKSLQQFDNTAYYFTKHYEMLLELQQYLLIRKRYSEYKKATQYISKYQYEYQRSLLIGQQMDQATKEVIGLISKSAADEERWENWLLENFRNEHLDGLNRYMAFVRLSYYYLKNGRLGRLEDIYDAVQLFFKNGKYYSRRLLLNFYDNSLVLYDRKMEYDTAYYYGKLSIKGQGSDQLLYLNNFVNILLKQQKYTEALGLINTWPHKVAKEKDNYSVIGFVANHVRCLTKTGKVNLALGKAATFWEAYGTMIMEYRWHRFFVAYLEALLTKGDYLKIIRLANRHNLVEREIESSTRDKTLNRSIQAMYTVSRCMEGEIDKSAAQKIVNEITTQGNVSPLDREMQLTIASLLK